MDDLTNIVDKLPLLNEISIGFLFIAISVIISLYKIYNKFKDMIIDNYEITTERDQLLHSTLERLEAYQETQDKINNAIEELRTSQIATAKLLEELDKRTSNYELSDTKDKLMQSFRYYTSPKHNPEQAWTELEQEAFFSLLSTYENAGGDGYIHTNVVPAMEALRVIPISDIEAITQLMHNRN